MQNDLAFLPLNITGKEAPWCVDGRPDPHSQKGPQMLGGSLLLVLIACVLNNYDFDDATVRQALATLKEKDFGIGVHRGHHADEANGICDCGFADKLPMIYQLALDEEDEIKKRINSVVPDKDETIAKAYTAMKSWGSVRIKNKGEWLVKVCEDFGCNIVNMEGDHGETVAFVNLKTGTTLDTNGLNASGKQAFNLDLWAIMDTAKALVLDTDLAMGISLILYVATEMVLVEMKGKPALPVVINN